MPRPYGRPVASRRAKLAGTSALIVQLEGGDELQQKLNQIADKEAAKIARAGMRAALKVTVKAMQDEAPIRVIHRLSKTRNRFLKPKIVRRRNLQKVIGGALKRSVKYGKLEAKAGIGVGKPKQFVRDTAFWAHWLVLGTAERVRKSFSKQGGTKSRFAHIKRPTSQQLRTGRVIGSNFIARGSSSSWTAAQAAMRQRVLADLQAYWELAAFNATR